MYNFPITVGDRFGQLTVLSYEGVIIIGGNSRPRSAYKVVCDCGTEKSIIRSNLVNAKSCGCLVAINSQKANDKRRIPNNLSTWYYLFNRHNHQGSTHRGYKTYLSLDEYISICSKNCYYCGKEPEVKTYVNINGSAKANGIDRIDNNDDYILSNCRPCCLVCNRMKSILTEKEFYDHIKLIYNNLMNTKTTFNG